jgi:hypothetical protein
LTYLRKCAIHHNEKGGFMMLRNTVRMLFVGILLSLIPLTVQAAIIPQFEDVSTFNEGVAAVKINGQWGFIDNAGIWVIKPQYTTESGMDELNNAGELIFVENYLPIKKDGKWGFINRSGEMIIAPNFDEVRPFSEGLAAVEINKKWGYVDGKGQVVISPQFDACGPFKEGLALITIDKGTATGWSPLIGLTKKAIREYVYVDKTGKVVIPGPFDDIFPSQWQQAIISGGIPRRAASLMAAKQSSFSEGVAATRTKAGVLTFIDKQGQSALEFDKDIAILYPFHNGVAYLAGNGKMLVIDRTGKRLAETNYTWIGDYSGDGLTVVAETRTQAPDSGDMFNKAKKTMNIYGYVNKDFQCVIQPGYQEAGGFFAALAPVKDNNRWHYIDMTGKYVNDLQFEAATDFHAGVAFVKTQGKYALINTKFESIEVVAP